MSRGLAVFLLAAVLGFLCSNLLPRGSNSKAPLVLAAWTFSVVTSLGVWMRLARGRQK